MNSLLYLLYLLNELMSFREEAKVIVVSLPNGAVFPKCRQPNDILKKGTRQLGRLHFLELSK